MQLVRLEVDPSNSAYCRYAASERVLSTAHLTIRGLKHEPFKSLRLPPPFLPSSGVPFGGLLRAHGGVDGHEASSVTELPRPPRRRAEPSARR